MCFYDASPHPVIDMDEKEIVYNDFVDINVAVASERGYVLLAVSFYLTRNRHDGLIHLFSCGN